MRIEAGSDDDEGTTTGAGGVSRAVRLAVRIEAERDDDDAAMTGAGGVSRAVRIAVRIEGRRRSDDEVDSFLWLPFVATVCGYRCGYRCGCSPQVPSQSASQAPSQSLQPSRPGRCSPEALTIAAVPQLSLIVAAAPQALTVAAAPQAPSQLVGAAAQAVAAASWASLLLFTPDPRGWVAVRIEGRRRDVFAAGVVGSPTGRRGDEGKPVNLRAHRVHRGRGRRTRVHDDDATCSQLVVGSPTEGGGTTTRQRRRGGDDATTTRRRRRAAAPDALTVAAAPQPLTVAAGPQAPSQSLQPPDSRCSPPPQICRLLLVTPDPR